MAGTETTRPESLYPKNRVFSLLFPGKDSASSFKIEEQTIADLELEKLFEFITPISIVRMFRFDAVREVVLKQCTDERAIRYRLDIFDTLVRYTELLSAFEALLPIIDSLNYFRSARYSGSNPMFKLASHICELESYLKCMETLKKAFDAIVEIEGRLSSEGLAWLHDHILETCEDPTFRHMRENLPGIASRLRFMRSVTIGVNLSDSLSPIAATVVSINSEPYSAKSGTLFNRLFPNPDDEYTGITPLRTAPVDPPGKKDLFWDPAKKEQPFLRVLFKDISDMLGKLCIPLELSLSRYARVNTSLFSDLKTDIVFYIYGARFLSTLKANGMPVVKPEIAHVSERVTEIEENYNINLFIQMQKKGLPGGPSKHIVKNRVALNNDGRIALITGPNLGGKTVYTQAIGLSQILFQAGMLVPGAKARMSPVDGLFTHFQLEEHMANESGRFADEIKRLSAIMGKITASGMLLMNESFASTSYVESLYVARDVLRILRVTGVRVAFSTHFHDLAMEVEELNESIEGESRLVSLVSVVGDSADPKAEVVRTFRIEPHPPAGKSYAGEVAYRYGINFDQLYDALVKRGVIKPLR